MAADAASRGMGRWCVLVAMVSGCLLVKMSLQPDGHADEPMPAAAPSEAAAAVSRPPPASSEALATLASSGPAIQPERSTASELLVSPETVPRDTRRHKMALNPFAWRQHRKKMTELTVTSPRRHLSALATLSYTGVSILQAMTSLKSASAEASSAQSEADSGGAALQASTDARAEKPTSYAMQWLAERWRNIVTADRQPAPATVDAPGAQSAPSVAEAVPRAASISAPGAAPSRERRGHRGSRKPGVICTELQRRYDVQPHRSWGSMNEEQRGVWTMLRCDSRLQVAKCTATAHPRAPASRPTPSATLCRRYRMQGASDSRQRAFKAPCIDRTDRGWADEVGTLAVGVG